MTGRALPLAVLVLAAATTARADVPTQETFHTLKGDESTSTSTTDPHYFNGIGSFKRKWEIRLDSGFGTRRVLTQRIEVARAFDITNLMKLVVRVNFGATEDTTNSLYLIQGPLPSLGVRMITEKHANFAFEAGVRALIPYSGPNDNNPRALVLARDAVLTSALGADSAWLPFNELAFQGYLLVQTRFCTTNYDPDGGCPFLVGAYYGGEVGSAAVTSWLGPQHGFIGSIFAEVFGTFPNLDRFGGLQVGGHIDLSLSAIWPGTEAFPSSMNVFVGWSPASWFQARAYIGTAAPLTSFGKPDANFMPYGLRAQFFIP